jgi:DNA-binding transcriptional LysR family regulator
MATIKVDPEDVVVFVAVVEHGSFRKAAEALGVPKSSISRRIGKLEQRLNTELLHRTTRQLSLTDAGRLYFERSRRALDELESAELILEGMRDEPRGLLRITIPVDLTGSIADIVAEYLARYPKVRVETHVTNARVDLVAEGFDVALRAGSLPDSSLLAKKLGDTCLQLVASPDYLQRRGRPSTLTDLESHDCLVFGRQATTDEWKLIGPDGPVSVRVSGPVAANDLAFLRALAERGAGICRLPRSVAQASIQAGALERVLPDYSGGFGNMYAVYPSTLHLSTKVQRFVELCTELTPKVL